jgi:hypothetical protein
MKFITHNDEDININGTCRQGYFNTHYAELVTLFGKPHEGDGYKVDWEWSISFEDGAVATIYNWKNGPNYGNLDAGPGTVKEWNIGGHGSEAYTNIHKVIWDYRQKEYFSDSLTA